MILSVMQNHKYKLCTTAAESWSLCLDLAGIMGRIHLNSDGCHWNGLNTIKHTNRQ